MNVRDLIDFLSTVPPDREVYVGYPMQGDANPNFLPVNFIRTKGKMLRHKLARPDTAIVLEYNDNVNWAQCRSIPDEEIQTSVNGEGVCFPL